MQLPSPAKAAKSVIVVAIFHEMPTTAQQERILVVRVYRAKATAKAPESFEPIDRTHDYETVHEGDVTNFLAQNVVKNRSSEVRALIFMTMMPVPLKVIETLVEMNVSVLDCTKYTKVPEEAFKHLVQCKGQRDRGIAKFRAVKGMSHQVFAVCMKHNLQMQTEIMTIRQKPLDSLINSNPAFFRQKFRFAGRSTVEYQQLGDEDRLDEHGNQERHIAPIEPGLLLLPAATHRMRVPFLDLRTNFKFLDGCVGNERNNVTTRLEIIVADALRDKPPSKDWFCYYSRFFTALRKYYTRKEFVVSLVFTDVKWMNIKNHESFAPLTEFTDHFGNMLGSYDKVPGLLGAAKTHLSAFAGIEIRVQATFLLWRPYLDDVELEPSGSDTFTADHLANSEQSVPWRIDGDVPFLSHPNDDDLEIGHRYRVVHSLENSGPHPDPLLPFFRAELVVVECCRPENVEPSFEFPPTHAERFTKLFEINEGYQNRGLWEDVVEDDEDDNAAIVGPEIKETVMQLHPLGTDISTAAVMNYNVEDHAQESYANEDFLKLALFPVLPPTMDPDPPSVYRDVPPKLFAELS